VRTRAANLLLGLLALPGLPALAGASRAAAAPPPRRVVSLAPSLTEIVFALGAGDRLVGVTQSCDYPAAARGLPRIGGMTDGTIDLERLLARQPDVVLAIGEDQATTVANLRRLGARVEVIESQTVADVFGAVSRVGEILGLREPAGRLRRELEQRVDRVRTAVAGLPAGKRPRVFFEIWDHPLMTASRATLAGQLIELAGGINLFADLSGRYVEVSPETVLQRNPQVILSPDHHGRALSVDNLRRQPGFAQVDAVRHGRVHTFAGDLVSRPGPRIALALELVGHALHPDLVPLPAEGAPPGAARH